MSITTNKTYHFITGLPRSGSTLLSSIFKQNPRFHASISDPLATLVKGVVETCQEGPGMKFEVPIERRRNLVYHLFEGYYADVDKPVIFNTNRAWTLLTPLMKELYPNSRMIVCVRDIKWILDSFELAHRRNPLSKNTFHGGPGGNVYSRAEGMMTDEGIVGFPYIGIKQAITSAEKKNIMLVEYDQLCKNPKGIVKAIYNFIGEEQFEHDFDNVEQSWDEYDSEIGLALHQVRKKVEYKPRETILPPDLIAKYSNMEVWRM
jgi:sulfotransferase